MARTVLPIVGAVVGSFFGAPQLGFAIGSAIGNAVDPQRIKGPRINDANLQTSQEGAPRPIVYGVAAIMGNLIDRGPLNKVITEERQGKGGGPIVESESLFMTFAIRICEGQIDSVSRIWEDEKLVYDVRPGSTILEDSQRYASGFSLYLGTETQMPDPSLETIHGVGETPAYRGTAYIVFREKNLTERRGSIPQFRFEVNGCITDSRSPVEKINALPPLRVPIVGWVSGTGIIHFEETLPTEGVAFYLALNDLSLPPDGGEDQYNIYLNGNLIFTTPVFPVGGVKPRVYYRIAATPGDVIRLNNVFGAPAGGEISWYDE